MTKGKARTFADILNKRLDKEELKELEEAAKLEVEFLETLQQEVSELIKNYMEKTGLGSSQMAKNLGCSPNQALRVINGRHGITMATVAHVCAAIGIKPHLVFESITHNKKF